VDERRRSNDEHFDRILDKLDRLDARADERHELTITRLTTLESNRKTDREEFDSLKQQCDSHDGVYRGSKWILGAIAFIGGGTLIEWFKNHVGAGHK
jgi:uncharacterized protein YdcH (DUF465 family)